ncbi:MAG TPA: hypothetical protein VHR41_13210 [Gemmatimonadales bacterium]|jgi:hypothetical protein|nr:hypothetical protein [Gemmatimonadales bacterium]
MRTFWSWTLLPVILAGCGAGSRSTPAEAPRDPPHPRDLTTPLTSSPSVQVISSREVIRSEPARQAKSRAHRPAPKAQTVTPIAEATVPAPVTVSPSRSPAPVETPVVWKGGAAALEPGQTVTMVPAESGPTPAQEEGPAPLRERRGGIIRVGGGGCHPQDGRGRGSVFRLSW